jgi:hypothetical protein
LGIKERESREEGRGNRKKPVRFGFLTREKRKGNPRGCSTEHINSKKPYVLLHDWSKLSSTVTQNAMVKANRFNFYICNNNMNI